MSRFVVLSVAVLSLMLGACCGKPQSAATAPYQPNTVTVQVIRAEQPVQIDGRLDDAVWQKAQRHTLQRVADNIEMYPQATEEKGYFQIAWDDQYLYVAGHLTDSDLEAYGKADQLHHYRMGDLMEVFLRPTDFTWYWEMYVTPHQRKTAFWIPGGGQLGLDHCFDGDPSPLRVGAQMQGTLNQWNDRDQGWTGEMAIPMSLITARGEKFAPGQSWLLLVARYNYSRYIDAAGPQLSSYPQLPKGSYHYWPGWAKLEIVK